MTRHFIVRTEPTPRDPILLSPVSEVLENGEIVNYSDLTEIDACLDEARKSIDRIPEATRKWILHQKQKPNPVR